MDFLIPNKYQLENTQITIEKVNNLNELENAKKYDKIIVLNGTLFNNGKKITSGSIIDFETEYSFLTNSVDLLCLSNINVPYINKIIYSKEHLKDKLLIKINEFKNIGLTSGCFDILHEGHIKNLKICKKNCDHLFVCLSSDKQIERLKGTKRPINNLIDRVNMLIHFDFIDGSLAIYYNEEKGLLVEDYEP